MANQPATERGLVEALNRVTSADPGPLPAPEPDTASAKTASRRCCASWQRAFKAYMDDSDGDFIDKGHALEDAAHAFCNVMPVLAGYEGIRDFIACAAHGIAIGAISPEKGGQLLYAAQVALNMSHPSTSRLLPRITRLPPGMKTLFR
jgi:hypothetical protein